MDYTVAADSTINNALIQGEPSDVDVLLGRGNHVNYRPGNIRFRQLAAAKGLAYAAARSKEDKDAITAQLVDEVTENGGRFLRQVDVVDEEEDCAWEVVTGQIVSMKVRQAMRDALKGTGNSPALLRKRSLAAAGKCSELMGMNKLLNISLCTLQLPISREEGSAPRCPQSKPRG